MDHETKAAETQPPKQQNNLSIPAAIVIAGVLIAGAGYLGTSKGTPTTAVNNQQPQQAPQQTGDLDQMAAISASDHVRGNPDAPVKIIEYSDTECPFFKRFHSTMQEDLNEYEKNGKVD